MSGKLCPFVLICLFGLGRLTSAQEVEIAREARPHYPRAEAVTRPVVKAETSTQRSATTKPTTPEKAVAANKPAPAPKKELGPQPYVITEIRPAQPVTASTLTTPPRKPEISATKTVTNAPKKESSSTVSTAKTETRSETTKTVTSTTKPASSHETTVVQKQTTTVAKKDSTKPSSVRPESKPEATPAAVVSAPKQPARSPSTAKQTPVVAKKEISSPVSPAKSETRADPIPKTPTGMVLAPKSAPTSVPIQSAKTEARSEPAPKTPTSVVLAPKPAPISAPALTTPSRTLSQPSTSSIQMVNNNLETAFIKLADGFDFPVGKPDAQGYYKARGFRSRGHLGEDWDGVRGGDTDLGDPIYCIGNGLVVFARDCHMGWGNVVIVRHSYREGGVVKSVDSLYGHLNTMLVRRGDSVVRGQKIATMGNAHGLYDAHLHLEVRKNLEIGMSRAAFAQDFTNYYDPSQFILTHRHLQTGSGTYKVAMNTFVRDSHINFDARKNYSHSHYHGGSSESAAALKKAVASQH